MEEIINNIMQSPENTNPNVLRSQLQNVSSSGGGAGEIKIMQDGENFVLSETITMPELYNNVQDGAKIYLTSTMPEQEDIIIHDYILYFLVQVISHITRNGNEIYMVNILNNKYNISLYLYNAAGSNEVIISQHAPGD